MIYTSQVSLVWSDPSICIQVQDASIDHHVYETPCESVEYIIHGIVETHGGPRSPISSLIIKLITYDALAELEALEFAIPRFPFI